MKESDGDRAPASNEGSHRGNTGGQQFAEDVGRTADGEASALKRVLWLSTEASTEALSGHDIENPGERGPSGSNGLAWAEASDLQYLGRAISTTVPRECLWKHRGIREINTHDATGERRGREGFSVGLASPCNYISSGCRSCRLTADLLDSMRC